MNSAQPAYSAIIWVSALLSFLPSCSGAEGPESGWDVATHDSSPTHAPDHEPADPDSSNSSDSDSDSDSSDTSDSDSSNTSDSDSSNSADDRPTPSVVSCRTVDDCPGGSVCVYEDGDFVCIEGESEARGPLGQPPPPHGLLTRGRSMREEIE